MTARDLCVWLAAFTFAVAGVALPVAMTGCEMLVQLDRDLVEAGEDAGCSICSGDAGGIDGQGSDGGGDADVRDATGEGSSADSAADSGG